MKEQAISIHRKNVGCGEGGVNEEEEEEEEEEEGKGMRESKIM